MRACSTLVVQEHLFIDMHLVQPGASVACHCHNGAVCAVPSEPIDVYTCGFSCKPHSSRNPRRWATDNVQEEGAGDNIDTYYCAHRHIRAFRPRIVLLENVLGVLHKRGSLLRFPSPECFSLFPSSFLNVASFREGGKGSATLSMAYAGARFGSAVLQGLAGQDAIECAYVQSDVVQGMNYFSSKVTFGVNGVAKVHPIGPLSDHEAKSGNLRLSIIPEILKTMNLG